MGVMTGFIKDLAKPGDRREWAADRGRDFDAERWVLPHSLEAKGDTSGLPAPAGRELGLLRLHEVVLAVEHRDPA